MLCSLIVREDFQRLLGSSSRVRCAQRSQDAQTYDPASPAEPQALHLISVSSWQPVSTPSSPELSSLEPSCSPGRSSSQLSSPEDHSWLEPFSQRSSSAPPWQPSSPQPPSSPEPSEQPCP